MKVEDPKEMRLEWKEMKENDEKGQKRETYTCLYGSTGVHNVPQPGKYLWIMIFTRMRPRY